MKVYSFYMKLNESLFILYIVVIVINLFLLQQFLNYFHCNNYLHSDNYGCNRNRIITILLAIKKSTAFFNSNKNV